MYLTNSAAKPLRKNASYGVLRIYILYFRIPSMVVNLATTSLALRTKPEKLTSKTTTFMQGGAICTLLRLMKIQGWVRDGKINKTSPENNPLTNCQHQELVKKFGDLPNLISLRTIRCLDQYTLIYNQI